MKEKHHKIMQIDYMPLQTSKEFKMNLRVRAQDSTYNSKLRRKSGNKQIVVTASN